MHLQMWIININIIITLNLDYVHRIRPVDWISYFAFLTLPLYSYLWTGTLIIFHDVK